MFLWAYSEYVSQALDPALRCYCSVAQSSPTLWDPMSCHTTGLPVLHHLLEFAQTQVYWVSDAIQPSSSASSSFCFQSFLASGSFPMSWLFTSGGQSIGASASVLPMNIQGWFPLGLTDLVLLSKGPLRVFSNTTVQKHQFSGAQPSFWSSSNIPSWLLALSLLNVKYHSSLKNKCCLWVNSGELGQLLLL